MSIWTVHANYDAAERIWYIVDTDVPGLTTEGESLERLGERVTAVLPELLELNAHELSEDQRQGPHQLKLVAFHEAMLPVAA